MSSQARLSALINAARRLSDPRDPLGDAARAQLPSSTGLSPENVELALREVLETEPTESEIRALIASAPPAPRVHVQLAPNVFTAPLRAIALALAQSPSVFVRASRREPVFARLLLQASAAFELVESLAPAPGDHLWAYGSDDTLSSLLRQLPAGVVLHAHGPGFGIALIAAGASGAASALASDLVPFDQRGCLSPRVAVVVGTADDARSFAREVALELDRAASRVPLGRIDDDERAACALLRETMSYAGEVFGCGSGWVAVDEVPQRLVPTPGARSLVVTRSESSLDWLQAFDAVITCVGIAGPESLVHAAAQALPGARLCPLGGMQRPAFDGPVDRRPGSRPRRTGGDSS
jgi:hypothetical protein